MKNRTIYNRQINCFMPSKTGQHIVIFSADKENATAVMQSTEYEIKIREILKPSTCNKL